MTRDVLIVMPRQGRIWDWLARKVLRRLEQSASSGEGWQRNLFDNPHAASSEARFWKGRGHPVLQFVIRDDLLELQELLSQALNATPEELQQHMTDAYQSFVKYRSELNRLSQFLGANFRGELPDLPSPADQAIALLERLRRGG